MSAEWGPSGRVASTVSNGDVGDGLERAGGDAFFDRGLAVEDDGDAFALQHELGVGPRGVAVRDEIDRARERALEHGGVDDGGADVRAFRAGGGVGFEDAGDAGFLDRREPGGQGRGDREDRLGDVCFAGL